MDQVFNTYIVTCIFTLVGVGCGYFLGRRKRNAKPPGDEPSGQSTTLHSFECSPYNSSAVGLLSELIRTISRAMHISPNRWNQLMDEYMADPRNDTGTSPRERSATRGNLNKEIFAPTASFKVFLKFLRVINPKSALMHVDIKLKDGTHSSHVIDLTALKS